MPFFSVIISTFNRATLLPRALASIQNQSEQDWEAFIVDDGSTDNTFVVVNKFISEDPRIIYLKHETNKGPGYAKNRGIFSSSGDYISFLDSDDEYKPQHLSIRKKVLAENPDIDLLHGGIEIIGNPFVPNFNNYLENISLDDCIIGGTMFLKSDVVKKGGGFPEIHFGDDIEFFKKAVRFNPVIVEIKSKTYIYHRETLDSICSNLIK
jgi:glycosyltransferase involved in cell wall biosynthesis